MISPYAGAVLLLEPASGSSVLLLEPASGSSVLLLEPASGSSVAPVALVAQPTPTPDDPGGRGEDFGKSTPVGLIVLIAFFIAAVFLFRSMNKHLRRVPESFDPPAEDTGGDGKRD